MPADGKGFSCGNVALPEHPPTNLYTLQSTLSNQTMSPTHLHMSISHIGPESKRKTLTELNRAPPTVNCGVGRTYQKVPRLAVVGPKVVLHVVVLMEPIPQL